MTKNKQLTSKILVAVDFSNHSRAALIHAAQLANCMQADLVVVHVVHDPGSEPGYYSKWLTLKLNLKPKHMLRLEDMAEDLLHDFIKSTKKDHPELKPLKRATQILVRGLPVSRILEVIDNINPYQLVMGRQGQHALKHVLLGSSSEQILRLCPIPVTIVKGKK